MIRRAKLGDFNGFLKVFREAQDLHATNEPEIFRFVDPIDFSGFEEMLKNENIIVLVSEDDELITGILVGVISFKESNLTLPRKMFGIENLAVLKSHHKKGIGKNLINVAKDIAVLEKCDSLNLNVWCFNENAIEFYRHLGFVDKSIKMQLNL